MIALTRRWNPWTLPAVLSLPLLVAALGVLTTPADPAAAEQAERRAAAVLAAQPVVLSVDGRTWTTTLADLGVFPLPPPVRPWWQHPGAVSVFVDPDLLTWAIARLTPRVELPTLPAQLLLEDESVRIDPGRPGWAVDRQALAGLLRVVAEALLAAPALPEGAQPGLAVELPLRAVDPDPGPAQMAALGVRRRLALFTSDFDPRIPRAENVARATAALDGLRLAPGEELSVLHLVGPVDAEHGWQQAIVIEGNRLVPGVGGGVCQVASTLYGAALRAGLTVLERHPHALAITYLPLSQDAAIAPGAKDLRLLNSTGQHLVLRAWANGGRVSVAFYGDAPTGQRIEVLSEQLETYLPETVRRPDPALPPGATAVEAPGAPGYRSVAWRLWYQDDQLVRRERLSLDSYPPAPRIVIFRSQ